MNQATKTQNASPIQTSKGQLWTSWVLSGIAILFMLFDSTIHILVVPAVVDASAQIGFPVELMPTVGGIELLCVILHLIPCTSVFGAILLTGYVGGAVAINARIVAPLFSNTLFPIYIAILFWGGLYLRDSKVNTLIPFRKG